jgi:DNA-directed RNA polymerase specialized sigma24 family protein
MTESDGAPVYFFLEDPSACDPQTKHLQELLKRLFPRLRRQILRFIQDETVVPDFMDRLYDRLKRSLGTVELTEQVVMGRLGSILHETRRLERKRYVTDADSQLDEAQDPGSLKFLTRLVQARELKKFRECVDPWTDQVIKLKLTVMGEASDKEIAEFLGMNPDAFYKRWRRGREAGRAEYRRRYGDQMP